MATRGSFLRAVLDGLRLNSEPLDILREVARTGPRNIIEWINTTVDDPELLHQLARRSTWHPNGFLKIVVAPTLGNGGQLRLHWWNRALQPTDCDMHNHRWAYASWIVCGAFCHELFAQDDSGTIDARHLRWVENCLSMPEDVRRQQARLKLISMDTKKAGDVYSLAAGVIHRIWPVEAGLSLVLQEAPSRSESDVFVEALPAGDKTRSVQLLQPDELALALGEVSRTVRTAQRAKP